MLVGFALLTKGRLFLTGFVNQVQTDAFWKKLIVPKMQKIFGTNNGSSHSREVLILVKEQLDFKLLSSKVDDQGHYILLHEMIQESPFLLINIYAPNKCAEQSEFLNPSQLKLRRVLRQIVRLQQGEILMLSLIQTQMEVGELRQGFG